MATKLYIRTCISKINYLYSSLKSTIPIIAQPEEVRNSLKPVSKQLAKTLMTLDPHRHFDKISYIFTFQHCLMTGRHNSLFYGRGFVEHQSKIGIIKCKCS